MKSLMRSSTPDEVEQQELIRLADEVHAMVGENNGRHNVIDQLAKASEALVYLLRRAAR